MTPRTKNILLIVAFVLFVIIMAAGIYYFLFRPLLFPTVTVPPTPVNLPPVNGLPPIGPAVNVPVPDILNQITGLPTEVPTLQVTPVIPGPVISSQATGGLTSFQTIENLPASSMTLADNGRNLVYYEKNTGFFYEITPDGQKKIYSDVSFKNVEKVTWSNNNDRAILEYPDGSNIIYDFNKKTSVTLPQQWEDFSFSGTNDQIAFKDMRLDPENRYISVADVNGTALRQIEPIGDQDNDVHVTWSPNDKYVALYRESIDGDRAYVYPIGFNQENFRKIRVEGRDLRFEWSPSGNKLLYSAFNSLSDYNPTLWVTNSNPDLLGTGRTKLELDTWADKCTFGDENTVFCAVPRNLDTGTGFLPNRADETPDDFYKINLSTGSKEILAQPLFPTTVDQLMISKDQQYLYWLEKNTGQIKKMNL